jgi:hypothetical protein
VPPALGWLVVPLGLANRRIVLVPREVVGTLTTGGTSGAAGIRSAATRLDAPAGARPHTLQ